MSDQRRESSHSSHDQGHDGQKNLSPDLLKRDPNQHNAHIKLMFEDIFAEPHSSFHSYDRVWTSSFQVFRTTKTTCYRVTSLLCAVPLSVCWGAYFACLACCSIWCCHPCLRALEVKMHCARAVCSQLVHACLRPCTEALALCFSSFKVDLHSSDEQRGFTI